MSPNDTEHSAPCWSPSFGTETLLGALRIRRMESIKRLCFPTASSPLGSSKLFSKSSRSSSCSSPSALFLLSLPLLWHRRMLDQSVCSNFNSKRCFTDDLIYHCIYHSLYLLGTGKRIQLAINEPVTFLKFRRSSQHQQWCLGSRRFET